MISDRLTAVNINCFDRFVCVLNSIESLRPGIEPAVGLNTLAAKIV